MIEPDHRINSPQMPGLARVLSKLGYCSRRQAGELARAGRVRVDGVVRRDPEFALGSASCQITVDGAPVTAVERVYLMLNKPRGLVTTAGDEKGRETVFACLREVPVAHLSPVGRLDQASEGLLLFTNDTLWAEGVAGPASQVKKRYHVQIDRLADEKLLQDLMSGVQHADGWLSAQSASVLRQGEKNAWLEIVLDEGRNRQIRKMLETRGIAVRRLVRVAVGGLSLGSLAKGCWRYLTPAEAASLAQRTTP